MSEGAEDAVPLRRNWNFQVLWISQTISSTGQSISTVAYPILILALTHSAARAGLVATIVAVCRYVGGVALAPVIDQVDRRRFLIICDSLRCATAAAVAVLVLDHAATYLLLVVLAGIGGFVDAPVGSAIQAAVVRVVPDHQLEEAMAQDGARSDAAGLAGYGLGGLLYGLAAAIPFAVQAAGFLASVLGAAGITVSLAPDGGRDERAGWLRANLAGLRWLRDRPTILAVGGIIGFINFAFAATDVLVIIFARRSGATSFETGLAVAMGSAAGIIGALFAARAVRALGSAGALLVPSWITVVAIPLLVIAPGFIGPGLVLALMSLFVPTANVVLMAELSREIPDSMRGRVWSFLALAINGMSAAGPLIAGALADSMGRAAALPLAAPALITALGFTLVPTLRNYGRNAVPGGTA